MDRRGAVAKCARNQPYSEALRHAGVIRGAWASFYYRYDVFAVKIGGTKRLHAQRVPADRSMLRELRRLLVAAKSKSPGKYARTWAGTSNRTIRWIIAGWAGVLPPTVKRRIGGKVHFVRADFTASHKRLTVHERMGKRVNRHVWLMPLQREAVPLIEAALRRHLVVPLAKRQRRKGDALADDFARAVCAAYRELTGRRGFTWDYDAGQYATGGLFEFATVIERQFDIEEWFFGLAGAVAARLRSTASKHFLAFKEFEKPAFHMGF